jgi:predicted enzyme related to lactoylglutathione lyase
MPGTAKLRAVTIDCPEPKTLGEFYQSLTGWDVVHSTDAFVGLGTESGLWIGLQQVSGYQQPEWPGQQVPQQFHLDFAVEDLDAAQQEAEKLGARASAEQPSPDRWRVMLDPAGHPFCLSAM